MSERHSRPSALAITDLRVTCLTGTPFNSYLIRIDTNQGISGYGEVRDNASKTYALMLKSRLLGENPCDVDRLFRRIKQFGHHGRQGGGVSAVEMALMDLAGKAYRVLRRTPWPAAGSATASSATATPPPARAAARWDAG